MEDFHGKRALVTGAGAGIGRGIAIKLAELGAEVHGIDINEENLTSLKEESPSIKTITLDITNWDKTREMVKTLNPIHLLVNNAGILIKNPALEATEQEFDAIFNLNVKALMNISQTVAKGLIEKNESGNIVNISSLGSTNVASKFLLYCSTKSAVDTMTKCFAWELGSKNIRVNAVNPFFAVTDLSKDMLSDSSVANHLLSRVPLHRFAEIEDIVHAVVYLLSDKSLMINGTCLRIDGGYSLS